MRTLAIAAVLSSSLCGIACQKDDKPAAVPDPSHVTGYWRGSQSIVQIETNETHSKVVEFNFGTDKNFQMKQMDDAQVATGTYTDFARTKNLFLEIDESTVPTLGLKGTAKDFTYDLQEDELLLKADKTTYKLKRGEAPKVETPKPLTGEWVGKDTNDNDWRLVIDEAGFTVAVTRDRRSLVMAGTVAYLDMTGAAEGVKAKGLLTVTRASPAKQLEYMLLVLKDNVTVYKCDQGGKPVEDAPIAGLAHAVK